MKMETFYDGLGIITVLLAILGALMAILSAIDWDREGEVDTVHVRRMLLGLCAATTVAVLSVVFFALSAGQQ